MDQDFGTKWNTPAPDCEFGHVQAAIQTQKGRVVLSLDPLQASLGHAACL